MAGRAATLRGDLGRTAFVGLCVAQGSGKSTVAAATVRLLQAQGLSAVALSLVSLGLAIRKPEARPAA